MSRTNTDFFVTISKYMRGSLTPGEIGCTIKYFNDIQLDLIECYIVNEHRNKKGEQFEHLHIYVKFKELTRSDKLRDRIKKILLFIQHQNDLDIRQVQDKESLLSGYFMKTDDYKVMHNQGITEEYIAKCKEKGDIAKELRNKLYDDQLKIKKNRIFKMDLPYIMYEYIIGTNINYDCTLYLFTSVIKKMLRENYDFELRGLPECKAKLDLLFSNHDDSHKTLNALINDQFKGFYSELDTSLYYSDVHYENVKEFNLNKN